MGVISDYYLNAATLASSTHVYTDENLSVPAPAGWYASNGVYRQVTGSSGQFVAGVFPCPSCTSRCPQNLTGTLSGIGLYSFNVQLSVGAGAVFVYFTPGNTPHGIRATLGTSVYNAVSATVDGYHASSVASNATYLGNDADACSTGFLSGAPYAAVTDYNFYDGSFYDTGNTSNVFVAPGDISFSSGVAPGSCLMVVPKTTSPSATLLVEIAAPASCIGTAVSLQVQCPAKLTGFEGTLFGTGCGKSFDDTYYNAPVTGTLGAPNLYDWIFTDPNGENLLADGDYIFDIGGVNGTPYTVANGVVTVIGTPCP
jgi:hypothetical protein